LRKTPRSPSSSSVVARVATHVADDDERALVREAQRDRAAEARGSAGDDGGAAGESHSRSV
jgi:hypothetical protein